MLFIMTTTPEPTGSRCQDSLLPRELEIMLLVVSIALALSFCLLLGYLCRSRLDRATKGCRNCFGPPPTPPRGHYASVPNFRTALPQPDPGPGASFTQTLRVSLRGEDNAMTEERIELRFTVNALAVPRERATGRRQRPGAAAPSADPGAALGHERIPIALFMESATAGQEADGYVTPSPSLCIMPTASALTLASPRMPTSPPSEASAPSVGRPSPSAPLQQNAFFPDTPVGFVVGEPSAPPEVPRRMRQNLRTYSESSALQ